MKSRWEPLAPPHPRLQGLSRSSHSLHVSVGLCDFRVLITLATTSRNVHYHVTATVETLSPPLVYWWRCRESNSGPMSCIAASYVRSLGAHGLLCTSTIHEYAHGSDLQLRS